ncbi:glycosyltransferase [Lactiplantibacillus daoliensis]|uniref:Glycosyltransferase n=1 Tax=Lactiplantibacillus daoliensis TaxID=2559916 RepID=A0ABW1UFU9_9LACO|nr:glycosyltransferase [Lactiplantibacillus daoliensis]
MELKDKVSVIMSTKNGEAYIWTAIQSILEQSQCPVPIIVVDDGSSDRTAEILSKVSKQYKTIKVLRNFGSKGLAYSLNLALAEVQTEYVARMDDDDISLHNRLETEIKFLEGHAEYGFVGTGAKLFDQKGIYGEWLPKKTLTLNDLFIGRVYIHPTVVFRTKVLKAVGGYSEMSQMNRIEDWNLWLRLYSKGFEGYNLQEAYFQYREDNGSFKKRNFKRRINQYQMLTYWRKQFKLHGKYYLYPYLPVIKGIFPQQLIRIYHKVKYGHK